MAKFKDPLGKVWFILIGAPLAAYFLLAFWIAPFLQIPIVSNIQQIITFSASTVESILIFLALWFGIAFGYVGGTAYRRKGK